MRYEHDRQKLAANVANHQVWFHEADDFEWQIALVQVDARKHYGETRFQAAGLMGTRLFLMVFILRETAVRLISLRRANRREVRRYADQNQVRPAD